MAGGGRSYIIQEPLVPVVVQTGTKEGTSLPCFLLVVVDEDAPNVAYVTII